MPVAAAIAQVPNVLDPAGVALIVQVVDSVAHILARTTPAGFELGVSGEVVQQVVEAQRAAAAQHLAAAEAALKKAGFANVVTQIVEGEPGPTLVDMALAETCEVVVMATHGRSGLRRAMLGSVADHVIRHLTGIPLLLVHPAETSD